MTVVPAMIRRFDLVSSASPRTSSWLVHYLSSLRGGDERNNNGNDDLRFVPATLLSALAAYRYHRNYKNDLHRMMMIMMMIRNNNNNNDDNDSGRINATKNHNNNNNNNNSTTALLSIPLSGGGGGVLSSPHAKSVVWMSLAMACHYLGYSLARSITISLFTSQSTGFKNSRAAFPLAMTFISPVSLVMLVWYGHLLEQVGAQGALIYSTLACAGIIQTCAMLIDSSRKYDWKLFSSNIPLVQVITGILFVFRESYVQLLTSQYWSFLASALSPDQSARWFGPIAGLTSITSAVAGMIVTPIVNNLGLTGALMGTSVMLLISLYGVSAAYQIAKEYGFEPKQRKQQQQEEEEPSKKPRKFVWPSPKQPVVPEKPSIALTTQSSNMFQKAHLLFRRVPVLGALFQEILASQGLATLLNVCFVECVGMAIPNDDQRAGWVGRYYSLINVITMVLQFAVLPPLMTILEPRRLWQVLPILPLFCTAYQVLLQNTNHPSLYIVSASLLVMKVSEYSARRLLDEMIFVPLDFESRYLGKEVLGVFGYRLGKSLMSFAISACSTIDSSFGLRKLSILSNLVSILWLKTAWTLSAMVPTKAEAEKAHQMNKYNK